MLSTSAGDFLIDLQDDAACVAGDDAIGTLVRSTLDQDEENRRSECASTRAELAAVPPGQQYVEEHGQRVDVAELEAYRDSVCMR